MTPKDHYEHDWDWHFWSGLCDQGCQWARDITDYNREVFTQIIESMIVGSIPDSQIECLEESYSKCHWSTIPTNAICDLYEAIIVSAYVGKDIEARDPLGQMFGESILGQLSFFFEHLDEFINDLKLATFLTVRRFFRDNTAFIEKLATGVYGVLVDEVFEVALPLVLERVKSSVARKAITTGNERQRCSQPTSKRTCTGTTH